MSTYPTKAEIQEEKRRHLALQQKYGTRITTVRKAREAFARKDYLNATKLYQDYLSVLAQTKEVDDIYKLSPTHFDKNSDITEMLLISHVYWDLSRINEKTPKLQSAFQLSLSQFVKFTINQPYQVLNSEMLRRYIKKFKSVSPQRGSLNKAYDQIFIQSKKCYIATMCLGPNDTDTQLLRLYKDKMLRHKMGKKFVEYYYIQSSKLVSFLMYRPKLKRISVIIFKPILRGLSRLLRVKSRDI